MRRALLLAFALAAGCAAPTATDAPHHFDGLGAHTRRIGTRQPEAQRWFDQGLVFTWSFNHDEAIRSFRAATETDPDEPMAWWGLALAHGPHINNAAMPPEREQAAFDAVQRAVELKDRASPVERELIEALAQRHAAPPADRGPLDRAYADAMRAVWAAHPDDADVGALCAEALMDLRPWDLWTADGTPQPGTEEIVRILEEVQRLQPDHPGALHLYIHAVEASPEPARALAAADRLRHLVPVSGHMLHMPSHIDVLLGHWQEAIDSNVRAMQADAAYRRARPEQDFHHVYMAHNNQMLTFAAMMSGRSRMALESARAIWAGIPDDYARRAGPAIEPFPQILYDALVRFGRWDEILAEPAPPEHFPFGKALWRFARATALAAKGRLDEAREEQERFREAAAALPADRMVAVNPASRVLGIADKVLDGEIAFRAGDVDDAIALLRAAAEQEAALVYMEPPEWPLPVRHALGAILLEADRVEEAETVYREDLAQWPDNGWSLHGLLECLERRGADRGEIQRTRERLEAAWKDADVNIETSCLCVAGR